MLEFTLADQVADLPLILTSSGQEWQFQVSIVTPHRSRLTGRSIPCILTSGVQIWQMYPRSAGRCTPTNALWDIYYGMYLAAILDSARKGGNFLLFLNNLSSKQSVSIVESCQM